MATVGVHYAAAVIRCAERSGQPIGPLLVDLGLSREQLDDPGGRVHGDQMTRLVQRVWSLLDDEFLGCTEHPCPPGVFALMGRYVLQYETLQQILEQGIHFYNLFTRDIAMRLVYQGGAVELEIDYRTPERDPDGFMREFWLVIWHRFSSWIIDKKITLNQVCFPYGRPAHDEELKLLFPCRQRFNRPRLKLSFAADYLKSPCVRTQRDLSRFLRNSPADMITIPGTGESYAGRIRSLLMHQDSDVLECPSFDELATSFNVSVQTLRRRLKREGTSYPTIKDAIRYDLAVEKLISNELTVAEISRQLGFSEPQSFSRAFKQWSGVAPSVYRQSHT